MCAFALRGICGKERAGPYAPRPMLALTCVALKRKSARAACATPMDKGEGGANHHNWIQPTHSTCFSTVPARRSSSDLVLEYSSFILCVGQEKAGKPCVRKAPMCLYRYQRSEKHNNARANIGA